MRRSHYSNGIAANLAIAALLGVMQIKGFINIVARNNAHTIDVIHARA